MIKKILVVLILNLMFFSNTNSEERNLELNKLFNQLKNNSNVSMAFEVEKKIWEIWSIHPSNNRKGYRLTELLAQGSLLIAKQELNKAYEIFSQIIAADVSAPLEWVEPGYKNDFAKKLSVDLSDANIEALLNQKQFLLEYGFIDKDFDLEPWIDSHPMELASKNI